MEEPYRPPPPPAHPWWRRILRAAGLVLIALGILATLGVIDRRDRQATTSAGSVESSAVRLKPAPGWGLLGVAAGAGLIWLARPRAVN
jgi:hypothetical protein